MAIQKTPAEIKFLREYNGQHGIVYYHHVKFTDGLEGEFSTNVNPQVKFTVGKTDYVLQVTKNRKDNNQPYLFFDIDREAQKAVQSPSTNQYKGNSYYDNPDVQKRITKSWSLEQAIRVLGMISTNNKSLKPEEGKNIAPDHIEQLAKKLYDWSYIGSPNPQQLLTKRQALEHAVSSMDITVLNLSSSDSIIKQAEIYLSYLNDVPPKSEVV